MKIFLDSIFISTQGESDVIDITTLVEEKLKKVALNKGFVCITVLGSTAGLITSENEPGLLSDLKKLLEKFIPKQKDYAHNRGFENNAHAHLRASFMGASLALSFEDGRLNLGRWQQILLFDFDTRAREREIKILFMGE